MARNKECRPKSRIPGGVVFGLILIAAGGVALLHNMGFLEIEDAVYFWPVILLLLGLVKLINRGLLSIAGHVEIAAGTVLLAGFNGFAREAERFWPLAVVYVGVMMTLRAILQQKVPPPAPEAPAPLPVSEPDPQDESQRQS